MSATAASWIGLVAAIGVVTGALLAGPAPYVPRAVLHRVAGPVAARRWGPSVRCGVLAGALAALVLAGLVRPDARPLGIAALVLVVLLGVMDLRWSWLPLEWTALLAGTAFLDGWLAGHPGATLIAMAAPAALLLALRTAMTARGGVEPLGLGDVWLVAGLGGLLGLQLGFVLLGLAALTGLVHAYISRFWPRRARHRYGVVFGTHLCGNYLALATFLPSI